MKKESKKLSESVILVTGAAGFIGFHLAKKLLESGIKVIGLDNFNNYYSVDLKEKRNSILARQRGYKINKVVNLAAQAGVRSSLANPYIYFQSNVIGF